MHPFAVTARLGHVPLHGCTVACTCCCRCTRACVHARATRVCVHRKTTHDPHARDTTAQFVGRCVHTNRTPAPTPHVVRAPDRRHAPIARSVAVPTGRWTATTTAITAQFQRHHCRWHRARRWTCRQRLALATTSRGSIPIRRRRHPSTSQRLSRWTAQPRAPCLRVVQTC